MSTVELLGKYKYRKHQNDKVGKRKLQIVTFFQKKIKNKEV